TIPSTITNLKDLKQLNIANNEIYIEPTLYKGNLKSTLPADIDKLTKLEWLSISNVLEGTIPASVGNLTNLKLLFISQDTLHFGKGDLTGTIPAEIGNLSQLQQLHISNQKLSGNLPATINNLSVIREMDFSDNLLSGPVPALNLPNIEYLKLNDNFFSGFSEEDGNCPDLKEIQLQNNQIAGIVPSWFGDFTKLKSWNISDNQIKALPAEIGNLTNLVTLRADNNLLKELPDGLATIINLQHLSASNNQIGYIPGNLGHSRSLVTLDLSGNQITSIPPLLGNCPDLYQVYPNNNRIDSIPASFANIRDGATVLLQENEMQGKIPEKLMTSETEHNKHVRLDSNRFVFNDIPSSGELKFGVRNQKNVALKKQVYKVQAGDAISIDIRSISNLSHPGNEYYWLPYPELTSASTKDERFSGIENNPVLQLVIDEKNAGNKYYCKVFNPASPSFSFDYNGTTVTSPCMEYLNTGFVEFTLATEEEIISEKYDGAFVTSLQSIPDNTISDGTITLVPPVKISRGVIEWEASADGITWEKVSESMERADLKANIKTVSNDMLVLTPKNTAYYRCSLNEMNCDPLYSDKLKVMALGNILFDEVINVTGETRTISVDSIEIVVPLNFHESDFRLTITKIDHPPAAPDSVEPGSAYDVSVSFAETFELPLLIRLKNIDKTKISEKEIDKFKAVYFDDQNREWKYFDHAHLSLKDSTIAFTTNHLTKLSWWREENAVWGYTDVYERNNIRVFYKDGETDFMKFGYARKQKPQAWHIAEIPLLVQDITEYLPKVMAEYKSLGLEVPEGKFSVYVKQMDDAGCVGLLGMMNGYMLIDATMSNPVELRQVLAHEYMHYTQDYYISANPGNSFWMEAHATLSDRMVWNDKEVPLCESEELLQSGRTSKISIFNFLSNSWDYWDKSLATNNLLGEIHYNYLAGTFLHYMRSEREKSEKLEPATLLKETSWFGSWRTYLGGYTNNHLNALLGDEYEEFVKYILSGKNEKFTLLNKKGNPYAYLQDLKNKGVFTHPVSYHFKEGDEMVQKDEIEIKVPYMAAKIVLLENTNPDTMILVNYRRNHNPDYDHRVY
ncbi:MAG: leucine-rich repeat domain-containing protein, partial [Bacteroidales bacterium]|nr:leucine-rich repeat domain-containing protein [Bacteroidales bacterium]